MINDFENHMVEVDDVMVKWCVKRKVRVPPRGTLTLRLTHHLTITSSTSTIWFSRSFIIYGQPYSSVNHGLYLHYSTEINFYPNVNYGCH